MLIYIIFITVKHVMKLVGVSGREQEARRFLEDGGITAGVRKQWVYETGLLGFYY
jgi:hypothetical protein